MTLTLLGIFLILHGLVHLLYFGLSRKLFDLGQPLAGWPERSWLFARFVDGATTQRVASFFFLISVLIFAIAGFSVLLRAEWWQTGLIVAAVVSSLTIFAFWDGTLQRLPDKGFVGILINVALVAVVLLADRTTLLGG